MHQPAGREKAVGTADNGRLWLVWSFRDSKAVIDAQAQSDEGYLQITASPLTPLLESSMPCQSIEGRCSKAVLTAILNALRQCGLDLTINLEKASPAAAGLHFIESVGPKTASVDAVTQVFNQIIHGSNTTLMASSRNAVQANQGMAPGDTQALVAALVGWAFPNGKLGSSRMRSLVKKRGTKTMHLVAGHVRD